MFQILQNKMQGKVLLLQFICSYSKNSQKAVSTLRALVFRWIKFYLSFIWQRIGGVVVLCFTAGTRLDTGVPGVNGIVVDFAHGAHILVGTNM